MAGNENEELFETLAAHPAPERSSEAVPRLRTAERRQVEWRPVSLDELVPDDHRVRAVWRFVEGLDLSALLSPIKSLEGRPGHPAADPRILLALWLFATIEGVGSARQVARLCGEHIAYRWLCGGVGMNAKTLADFRVGHGAALEDLLIDSFAGLVMAGVASLDRVAQDGVRVRASAGAASFAGIRPWKTARKKRRKRYAVFKKKPPAIPARRAGARPRRDYGRPVIASAGSRKR